MDIWWSTITCDRLKIGSVWYFLRPIDGSSACAKRRYTLQLHSVSNGPSGEPAAPTAEFIIVVSNVAASHCFDYFEWTAVLRIDRVCVDSHSLGQLVLASSINHIHFMEYSPILYLNDHNIIYFKLTTLTMHSSIHVWIIYTTIGEACVCVCVCKIGPISARTLSFRHQTSRNFFSHSNFPIPYLWTAFLVPLSFVFYEKQ